MSLVQQLPKIYLLYFLTGNHESWSNKFIDLEEKLKSTNVKVLRNESHLFEKKQGQVIEILGIDDPAFTPNTYMNYYTENYVIISNIETANKNMNVDNFKILLAYRPEYFETYVNKNIDLFF